MKETPSICQEMAIWALFVFMACSGETKNTYNPMGDTLLLVQATGPPPLALGVRPSQVQEAGPSPGTESSPLASMES